MRVSYGNDLTTEEAVKRAFCGKVLLPVVLATQTISQAIAHETPGLDSATALENQDFSVVGAPIPTDDQSIRIEAEVFGSNDLEYDFTPNRFP